MSLILRYCILTASLSAIVAGCGGPALQGPYLLVLGTAQDGGFPHAGCWCAHCRTARASSSWRRNVASLSLHVPIGRGASVFLFDATPDVRIQLDVVREARGEKSLGVNRRPVDGLFLTHAHIGHYLGLAFFGYEAMHSQGMPVFCTPRMASFLRDNGPWNQLVRLGNIAVSEIVPSTTVRVPADARPDAAVLVTPILVPHRDEYSDTVGYLIRAEAKALGTALYIPDTEPWSQLKPPLVELIDTHGVTTLIVDGTFYTADELPDRGASQIGHPLMKDTMTLLEPLVKHGRLDVYFSHLNHSNPALDPASAASREIRSRGFHIAREGMRIPLISQTALGTEGR